MRLQRQAISVVCVGATLLAHVLLLTPMLWGGAASNSPRQPDAAGANANAGSPQGMSTERLILIDLGSSTREPAPPEHTAHLPQPMAAPTLVQILGPDSLPMPPIMVDPEGESAQISSADLIARTQLAGIYESQIRARIERAWRRPRTGLADDLFQCQVKVWQDAQGNVLRVSLQECEGTQAWFDSMINAVQAASPLPAPPNPTVFMESFQMSFTSVTYKEGINEQGFDMAQLR
jgi:outer membrane biosynthesis protein TonB